MSKSTRPGGARRGFRQEVLNVVLAQLLRERGIISAPEDVLASSEGRRMPDVLVDFAGLRTAIEGEVDDQPDALQKAQSSAARRVEQGIAQIGLAIVYPAELRHVEFADLKNLLARVRMRVSVVTEAGQTGYADSDVDGLSEILRHTFDQLVKENVVAEAVVALETGIEGFAAAVGRSPAVVTRLAEALGIGSLVVESPSLRVAAPDDEEE